MRVYCRQHCKLDRRFATHHLQCNNNRIKTWPKVGAVPLCLEFFIITCVTVSSDNQGDQSNPTSSGWPFASKKEGIEKGNNDRRQGSKDNYCFNIGNIERAHIAVDPSGKEEGIYQVRLDVLPFERIDNQIAGIVSAVNHGNTSQQLNSNHQ